MKLRWLLPGALVLLALAFFSFPGHSFCGLVCLGIAALLSFYFLLPRLKSPHPRLYRILLRSVTILLMVGLLAAAVTEGFILSASLEAGNPPCDYLVVLGAGVNGSQPSLILSQRINRAAEYLQANPQAICIASGGQGSDEDISEAQCIFQGLTTRGISPDRIWLEDRSTSTRENLRFTVDLITARTGAAPKTLAVLSNDFHLFRASLYAREVGVEPICISAPTGYLSLRINYDLREIPGVWLYYITGG